MATVVLVHGTTAGGWVWKKIAAELEAFGHVVYRPTLTGLGERSHLLNRDVGLDTHIHDVVNVLEFEDLEDVVLVGHSYGGAVIEGVADRVPERIAKMIYLDAVVLEDGEALIDVLPPALREQTERQVQAEGQGWLIPLSRGPNDVITKNTPHPYRAWAQPIHLSNPKARDIPRVYVRFTADKQPGAHFSEAMEKSLARVKAAGWPLYEVDTVHQITPDPQPKADILLKILSE